MKINGFNVTTEHLNDVDVLCKVYWKNKLYEKFVVQDYGDWNKVEDAIDFYTANIEI